MTANAHSVHHRQQESLYHALGPLIAEALSRPDVVEIMANPDGSLWVDRAGGRRDHNPTSGKSHGRDGYTGSSCRRRRSAT